MNRPARPLAERLLLASSCASWGLLLAACAAGSTEAASYAVILAGAATLATLAGINR